jgi:glutathionylspermidine synthase
MERITIDPRPDWQAKVENLGLSFHSADGNYWDESAYYQFTAAEIDTLEAATNELHRVCLAAVQHVLDANLFSRFQIPDRFARLIKNSWEREDLSLYGRFDLTYDGKTAPKMYEYNADTPTSLLEASVIQWHWLEERFPERDQFNSIHEKLVARWQESGLDGCVHFACIRDHGEDLATTVYMQDTAIQNGLKTKRLFIDEIGWDGRHFLDLDNTRVTTLFKLYPWEWLINERFSPYLLSEPWQIIEPAWKMVLSNKNILPLLWEMFPNHPNLLPAYVTSDRFCGSHVKKPVFGREGANITITTDGTEIGTSGDYAQGAYIYQALMPPPKFDTVYPVIGSWIVRDEAAGIGIRESSVPITENTSRFVPHLFC